MIQPVPIKLSIEYRGLEDKNVVSLEIEAEDEMRLSLAPQALQILPLGSLLSLKAVLSARKKRISRL